MDPIDTTLLSILQANARISMKALAGRVGLSPPATAERMRKLETNGVIEAFTATVNAKAVGYTLEAIVRVRPLPGKLHLVQDLLETTPQVIECDKVTGDDGFVARVVAQSIEHLDDLLEQIAEKAQTSSAIVKRKVVSRRNPAVAQEGR
ncbi:Lrp/AsnC family transcriptional regulator [Caulobacter sp. UNC358MFTsu5.1]|uniref:Lrp/AsnC family transcriptional regulator n=1 Tax=Caulobacter sp. UNC358MFTsu5.1 TaxID=1449049 RepID=UPI0004A6DF25|nr:Lrp/AsnC family transcriptional regulator [Caulobacter sp. UNC358MFTsu5.1]